MANVRREFKPEGRSGSSFTFETDSTIMQLDRPVSHREPNAGSVQFGCEV
jgi:hypothetical protein